MKNSEYVFAVDIGSSKIRTMVAGKGLNNTFNIKGFKEIEYDGFYEGRFLNQDKISLIFEQIIDEFDIRVGRDIDKVYISVPSEFSSVHKTEVSINFGDRRKVKKQDIDSLYYMASEKGKRADSEIVSVNANSFILDDGRTTLDPIGESAVSIIAKLSIIYGDKKFIDLFNGIVASLGFEAIEYISSPLSQCLFLLPSEKREDLALLIDIGDLTSSIAFVQGDGLYALSSFSRGGGFITNDLSQAFDLSMSEADRLKRQVVLSLKGKPTDTYELLLDNGQTIKISQNACNEVVGYRIDEMAEVISKCIKLNTRQFSSYLPVILTGSGLCLLKGGRDYLAKCLGRNVEYGKPDLPGKEKPELASILSLVNSALD